MGIRTKNWALSSLPTGDNLLMSGQPNEELLVVGLILSNYDPTNDANINLRLYNGATMEGYVLPSSDLGANSSLYIDTKVFFNEQDYILAESSVANVSIIASGSEKT